MPMKPSLPSSAAASAGNFSSRSRSAAWGASQSRAKSRATSRSMRCSSLNLMGYRPAERSLRSCSSSADHQGNEQAHTRRPGEGVVSREFSEELGGCLVVDASQAGAIVVGHEGVEVGVAFIVVAKAAMVGDMVLRHPVEMLAEAAVEALDHAVGLRSEGPGEAVSDRALGAELVKGMGARGFVVGLGFLVDGEAVGKFGAVVGQDGVDRKREAVEEAREKTRGGGGAAIGEDFEIEKASSAIDRDIGVAAPAAERRRVFDIDVDKAGRRVGSESGGRCLVGGEAGGEIVPHQAAVDSAARQLRVDAAAYRFDDVVERQREAAAQFDDQRFLPIGDHGGQAMRAGGAVGDVLAGSPTRHGAAMNAELAGQRLSR